MRVAEAVICLLLALSMGGCGVRTQGSEAAVEPTAPVSQPVTRSVETTPEYPSLDAAVTELADRAAHDDLAYFRRIVWRHDETYAREMIRVVRLSGIADTYGSRIESAGAFVQLNYHDVASFQVSLVESGGKWAIARVWP